LNHQKQRLAINYADTSIRTSRLCFPAFILQQIKGMAEKLAGVGL
jgi:hypothetical protein